MFNANKARDLVNKFKTPDTDWNLPDIEKAIKKIARKGKTSINYVVKIGEEDEVTDKLRRIGFNVMQSKEEKTKKVELYISW